MQKIEWLQFIVRISFGPHPWSAEFHQGVELLRKIEGWLRENHIPYAICAYNKNVLKIFSHY